MSLAFDALAPTNFLLTNPAALKNDGDTGGVVLREVWATSSQTC